MDALWLLATVVAPLLLAMTLSYAIIRDRLEIRSDEQNGAKPLRIRRNHKTEPRERDDGWR